MKTLGSFPNTRLRRNRREAWNRRLVAETSLTPEDFIYPIFVSEGINKRVPVASMPGVDRITVDLLDNVVGEASDLGVPAVAIFPEVDPNLKTRDAREAYNPDNLVCRSIKAVKSTHPDVGIICDAALDPFNSDGHDGLVVDGNIVNDESVEILCKQSLVQAEAGCHVIAPSDMMDGRVAAIRRVLDENGFQDVRIMSYAAKFASSLYGPFREALNSEPKSGDKKSYQINPKNYREAIKEILLDEAEGADLLIVKPASFYLDVIRTSSEASVLPIVAYQVSGEYSMIKAAAKNGYIDNDSVMKESLESMKRAGATIIITYFALEMAKLLKK